MASEKPNYFSSERNDKKSSDGATDEIYTNHDASEGEILSAGSQHLHRKLRGREVQLFAVGGAIGTCMSTNIITYSQLILGKQRSSCKWERFSPKEDPQDFLSDSSHMVLLCWL